MFKIKFLFFTLLLSVFSAAQASEHHELWTKCGLFNYSQKIDTYNYFFTKAKEQRTAYHEAGHALICVLLGKKIAKATIIPDKNKNLNGNVLFFSTPYDSNETLKIFLAGYATEEIIYKQSCFGIKGDLDAATEIASKLCSTKTSENIKTNIINQLQNILIVCFLPLIQILCTRLLFSSSK